jgi:hypothetical protein
MKLTREDMLTELASDMVSSVYEMAMNEDYSNIHAWLQPMFIESLKADFPTDEALEQAYRTQLGVEIED